MVGFPERRLILTLRYQRDNLLFKHALQERRLQQSSLGSHVRFLAAVVLRRKFRTLAFD